MNVKYKVKDNTFYEVILKYFKQSEIITNDKWWPVFSLIYKYKVEIMVFFF